MNRFSRLTRGAPRKAPCSRIYVVLVSLFHGLLPLNSVITVDESIYFGQLGLVKRPNFQHYDIFWPECYTAPRKASLLSIKTAIGSYVMIFLKCFKKHSTFSMLSDYRELVAYITARPQFLRATKVLSKSICFFDISFMSRDIPGTIPNLFLLYIPTTENSHILITSCYQSFLV